MVSGTFTEAIANRNQILGEMWKILPVGLYISAPTHESLFNTVRLASVIKGRKYQSFSMYETCQYLSCKIWQAQQDILQRNQPLIIVLEFTAISALCSTRKHYLRPGQQAWRYKMFSTREPVRDVETNWDSSGKLCTVYLQRKHLVFRAQVPLYQCSCRKSSSVLDA